MKLKRKIASRKRGKKRFHTIANQKKAAVPIVISERVDLK